MTFLSLKDPVEKIKSRSLSKSNVFKMNRMAKTDVSRCVDELPQWRLPEFMNFNLVSDKDLIHLVHTRSEYLWIPHLKNAQRAIVSSCNQKTTTSAANTFKSLLPDGSYASKDRSGCIIDTFLLDNVYWALDVLIWKDCQLLDCEAEFRSHWLSSCLPTEITHVALANEYSINLLPRVDGNNSNWVKIMKDWVNNENYDGILVYHKNSYYLPGSISPLVFKIPSSLWKLCEF